VKPYVRWESRDGWRGWIDPGAGVDAEACVAVAESGAGRSSRHARTVHVATSGVFVKAYPAPDGRRASRAFRMGRALAARGFGAPTAVLVARRGDAGLLVTRDVGGTMLADAVARLARDRTDLRQKRALLARLGSEVGRLHAAGFVHGDLVPPNVQVRDRAIVFLDHDRTRRSRFLVWLSSRRNLVQLGRFVVPGVTLTDRARVLAAYAAARGLSAKARQRLGWWVVAKTTARRCAIDRIGVDVAARVGFRELMRSGGRFDPERAA
jgi:hypothetical protein